MAGTHSPDRAVLMLAIPDRAPRGMLQPLPLNYVRYGRASWAWWCRNHGVEFIFVDSAKLPAPFSGLPAQVRRWVIACDLLAAGEIAQLAVVDADTMVRWDTPDFFALCGEALGAVVQGNRRWIAKSVGAYGPLFPGVTLEPDQYFNSGVVVFSRRHVDLLREFGLFYAAHLDDIRKIWSAGREVGIDQTILNFMVLRSGIGITPLPKSFNMIHCIHSQSDYRRGRTSEAAWNRLRRSPQFELLFKFIEEGYVWHFNGIWATRALFMSEVWKRVHSHYDGAVLK